VILLRRRVCGEAPGPVCAEENRGASV
jgi:hypothetical protein